MSVPCCLINTTWLYILKSDIISPDVFFCLRLLRLFWVFLWFPVSFRKIFLHYVLISALNTWVTLGGRDFLLILILSTTTTRNVLPLSVCVLLRILLLVSFHSHHKDAFTFRLNIFVTIVRLFSWFLFKQDYYRCMKMLLLYVNSVTCDFTELVCYFLQLLGGQHGVI